MGYLSMYAEQRKQRAASKKKSGGFFGLDLPNLGIGQAFKELGAIPGGLLRLGTSLAPGGEKPGDVWGAFAKGAASSLAGTAINVADIPLGGLGPLAEAQRDLVGNVLGEEYTPKSFAEMYEERGILGPAIETVGNAAIGAGALGKLAKAGDIGRLAAAESATVRAAQRGATAADIGTAAEAAKAGHGFGLRHKGFQEAGIGPGELREAGKAVARAEGRVAPAEAVAARTKTVNRLYSAAHPYRSVFEQVLAPVTREAHVRSITGAKAATPPADLAPDRAASLIESALAGAAEEAVDVAPSAGTLPDAGGVATAVAAPDVKAYIDESARAYAQANGLPEPTPVDTTAQVDPVRGRLVASMYKAANSDPDAPEVQAAYQAFAADVVKQYRHLRDQGVDLQFVDRPESGGIYADEGAMFADIEQGRMSVDRTGPGEEHLMPAMNEVIDVGPDGTPVTVNDAFRAVHDYFGHSRAGNLFDRHGEDVAWRLHEQMFSPEAKPALFTETVGQNSYLNFEPQNVAEKALGRQAQFPDQKAALLPEHVRDPNFRPSEMGPQEQATLLAEAEPTPQWAARVVDRLPEPAIRALYKADRSVAARRASAVIKERIRLQDIARRKVLHGEAVVAGRDAAEGFLVGRTLPDGTLIVPEVADALVGDTIIARLDLTDALEHALAEGATDEQLGALREAMVKLQLRSEQRIPETWLKDTDGTLTELGAAIEDSVEKMRGANAERLDVLRSTRKGDKGLENVEDTTPALSPRAQKLLAKAARDVATAEKLAETRIPKEVARTERRIQKVGDQITRLAHRIQAAEEAGRTALRDFDRTRKYVPAAFRTDAAWGATVDTIVAQTLDNGGASFDPHQARLLEPKGQGGRDTGFAVGATRGTAKGIQLTGQKQTDAVALAEGVDAVARAYQDLLQNPRVILGTWVDDANVAHIDVSEIVPTRDEALLKAAARQQDAIYDLGRGLDDPGAFPVPAGRPDVAVEFLQNSKQRTRFGAQLRRSFEAINARRAAAGLDPLVTVDDLDAQMAVNDLLAVNAARTMPGKFKTPDAYYAKMAVAQRKTARTVANDPAALFEMVLGKDLSPELIDEALATVPNAEKVMGWYQRTNESVRARYTKPDGTPYRVTLGNGKVVEVADLIHQLIAVTSIQQTPGVNLGDALHAVANYQRIITSGDEGVTFWKKLMDEFLATPAKNAAGKGNADSPRGLTELFERAIKPAEGTTVHRYWTARYPVIEILNGNTLDTWGDINPETGRMYVEERQALAGSKPKPIDRDKALARLDPDVVARLGEDRAVMEWHGQLAFAKIRSFYDNLRDPVGSDAVTLDIWMARLLGADTKLDLMKPGTYLQYAEEMRDLAGVLGDRIGRKVRPHEVQALLWAYAMNETHKAIEAADGYGVGVKGKRAAPPDWRDFADHLEDPGARLQNALDEVDSRAGETFFQKAKGHILGAMVAGEHRNLMYFFEDANPVTLVHENAHALRQILGDEDMTILQRAYKVTGQWERVHEERFAKDFETYLATREAPTPGLAGYFARIASVLGDAWRFVRGKHLHSDVSELLDRWLNPAETTIADADVLPEFAPLDDVRERLDGAYTQTERSPRQRAQGAPVLPELSPQEAYRRGVKGGEALAAVDTASRKAAELEARKVRLEKNLDKMKATLIEGRLDSQVLAQRLTSRAEKAMEKVARDLEQPSLAQVPAAWQPAWSALKKLHAEAATNPDLAALLEDLPEQWGSVLRIARDNGFDPVHVRSFQPSEVRKLVYGNVTLGKKGRDLGQSLEAGTRKQRRQATARTRSLDALAAASIEATHELHTNALADFIENTYARPVEGNTIPDGYVGWDAERSFLLTGEKGSDGSVTVAGMGAPTKMIPKEVKATLDNFQRDFSHPVFQNLRRVLDPWRMVMLTLSPRWYVNNFAGNLMLATKEGVRLQDWAEAWRSYRKGGTEHLSGNLRQKIGAGKDSFGDALGAIEGSVVAETGEGGLVRYPQGIDGVKLARTVSRGEAMKVATARLRRANEVVDEIARVAVYKKNLREGASEAMALKRTYEALVDYNDLSPFERQVVRSVVPFYSWQKGILKLTARFPLDHPQVAGIMMSFQGIQQQLTEDYYGGELPEAYASIIPFPGLGNVNTRSINPFQDAAALTSPQGIAASLSPFLESGARNALGAPEGGFAEHYRIDEFGSRVPDTSPAQDLTETITGLPQFRLGESLSGRSLSGIPSKGAARGTGSFVGVPTYDDAQIQKIVQRLIESRQRQAAR